MRILHYLPSLDTTRGGPVRAVFDLARGLAGLGHQVTLTTLEVGDGPRDSQGVALVDLGGPMVGARNLTAPQFAHAKQLIGSHDVLHVHGVWNYSNVQLTRWAHRTGKPYLLSPRGMLDEWSMQQRHIKKRMYLLLAGRAMLERAAAVHCTAEGELLQSRRWFPRGHGVVLPNFLDLNPFRRAPGPAEALSRFPTLGGGRRRVLFLSRLHYKKGADVFLEAAAIATRAGVDATWVLAGSGDAPYEKQMRDLAASLGLTDRVVFTGHVGGTLKVSLYQACELFALPTSQENFGFVFPESLACGTPVVTTKGVDIWPELEASGGSLVVERSAAAFARAVGDLLGDDERRLTMGTAGKTWVFQRFDERRLIGEFDAVYRACTTTKVS
ncbi:MAG: glycosyltransferase [Phycisphaerales bacterium]